MSSKQVILMASSSTENTSDALTPQGQNSEFDDETLKGMNLSTNRGENQLPVHPFE